MNDFQEEDENGNSKKISGRPLLGIMLVSSIISILIIMLLVRSCN